MTLHSHALLVGSDRSVEPFTQDVGVASVPTGLGKEMDEDVEQGHLGVLPPGHAAGGIESEGGHRRVAVVPHASVTVNDVAAGLVLGRPHVGESLDLDVPPRQGLGKGTAEDLAEVPGLPGRQVLDKAQQVGPSEGQRATYVVLGEPVQLGEQRLAIVLQVVVEVRLRGVVVHGTAPCHQWLPASNDNRSHLLNDAVDPGDLGSVSDTERHAGQDDELLEPQGDLRLGIV